MLRATTYYNDLTRIEVVVTFAVQIEKYIGQLGMILEGITLDSPGENTDPSTGRDKR